MAKCVLVPTGRHVVAMGVSPWLRGNRPRPKPQTGRYESSLLSSLRDFAAWGDTVHGLTPMATSCRPFGTKTLRRFTTQCVRSGRDYEFMAVRSGPGY